MSTASRRREGSGFVVAASARAGRGFRLSRAVGSLLAGIAGLAGTASAADVTWLNATANFAWDTASGNWSTGTWNNTAGDGAIFDLDHVGTVGLSGAINANSINFTASDYELAGAGTLNLVNGTSTLGTGVINVNEFFTATISAGVNSSVGFRKAGAGELVLSGPINATGSIPLGFGTLYTADFLIGGGSGISNGGTVRLNAPGIMPSSTRLAIGRGLLDLTANDLTIASLTLTNNVSTSAIPWDNTKGINGIYGTGTLKVDGEIHVFGQNIGGGNLGNSITSNVDLGNKSQIIRVGRGGSIPFPDYTPLMITGTISNGSLFKTLGTVAGSTIGGSSGIGLFGNNTYTGESIFNMGGSAITGTNDTTAVTVSGANGNLTLFGASGSILSATAIRAVSGATFIIDNTANTSTTTYAPLVPAAQNNDRIRDDAVLIVRDGSFTYRGLASTAASETWGGINHAGGNSVLTLTPGATGGSVTLTVAGDLTLASRASMTVTTSGSGNTLAGNAKLIVTGAKPATDSTGIFNNIVSGTDFLTYDATNGFTPYAAYATDLSTPGTNATIGAATNVTADASVNAIKRSATSTITISSGQTLTVSSGMMLAASGTATTTGGTLAVGNVPLRSWGTNTISSAVTGTAGAIVGSGTLTLSGDLSGLSGAIDINSGTATLSTGTFTGDINIRNGTLNLNASTNTASSYGTITMGAAENADDQVGQIPTFAFNGAGANAVFNNNIVIDNGSRSAAGMALSFSLMSKFTPLSNSTGSQTFNGNLTLNSEVNLQGGGGTGTGATVFNGAVTGPATFVIPNGRVIFGQTSSVANTGGYLLGNGGFTAQVSFLGTGSGSGPITIIGGNSTQLKYESGALPGGLITSQFGSGLSAPTFFPLENSTISNAFNIIGDTKVDVASDVSATWSGPIAGSAVLTKLGVGALVLSNDSFTKSGGLDVQAGILGVRYVRPGNGNVTVAAGATLQISPGATAAENAGTSKFNDTDTMLTLAGGATPTATLDIGLQAVVFDYTTTSSLATIKSQVLSGYNTGDWLGLGIMSSAAAAAPTTFGIGFGEASEFGTLSGTLAGVGFDTTSVLVRFTRRGDADLNGTVNFNDLLALARNYNGTDKGWSQGDFDYNGGVDFNDLLALARNYNLGLSLEQQASLGDGLAADFALARSLVPEPTSLAALALGTTLLRRRRA